MTLVQPSFFDVPRRWFRMTLLRQCNFQRNSSESSLLALRPAAGLLIEAVIPARTKA
jgi:hypothetical protein